ncbi:unnamed protein product [Clonostachys rosea]|uniref:FHA domain-containing protein n=1 Tax=Bionectria ochroleuca TaxID=29856 RepID=A0ABY6UPJ9_BIOOC|nr:unnamed protein product [Clonostachys rosea]
MAARASYPATLYLAPVSSRGLEAPQHPDNKRYVSEATTSEPDFEAGFHVPSIPADWVSTRLGPQGDVVLPRMTISAVHVAFEIHPVTNIILLSVRTKHALGVRVAILSEDDEEIEPMLGDGAITYGCRDQEAGVARLKKKAVGQYEDSLRRAENVHSRLMPAETDEHEACSSYNTRIHMAKSLAI